MQFFAFTSLALASLVAVAQASPMISGNGALAEVLATATAMSTVPETTSTGRPKFHIDYDPDMLTCG